MFDKDGLVESTLSTERALTDELFSLLDKEAQRPQGPQSIRLGFTGAPGVGKSTLIEAFGMFLIEKHNIRLAVLVHIRQSFLSPRLKTVDPSSTRSGGSILGDKTRMPNLSAHPRAYIRSSPNRGDAGGVITSTFDSIRLCECREGILVFFIVRCWI